MRAATYTIAVVPGDQGPAECVVNYFGPGQGGTVDDFELRFKFRLFGPKANSGMQFRSQVKERGLVHGYQADMATAMKPGRKLPHASPRQRPCSRESI